MIKNEIATIELTEENIESMVYQIRGQKVMLDFDLARVYGYETRDFNNQIKNNIERFDGDFRFQLSKKEWQEILKLNKSTSRADLRLKKSTAKELSSKRRYNPYAFTEQGIYMLMTVLKGELAVKQSKALIRLFKRMKDYIVETNNLLTAGDILELSNQVYKNTKSIEILKRNDSSINKKLTKVMDNFIDPSKYKHFLILDGQKIEGDVVHQQIYSLAKQSIYIIDDYIDVKTLQLLKVCPPNLEVIIFSNNKATNSLTKAFINEFIEETNIKLSFRTNSGRFHDRYIVIDYQSDYEIIYHCGSSSKDTGHKVTTIMKVENPDAYHSLLEETIANNNEYFLID